MGEGCLLFLFFFFPPQTVTDPLQTVFVRVQLCYVSTATLSAGSALYTFLFHVTSWKKTFGANSVNLLVYNTNFCCPVNFFSAVFEAFPIPGMESQLVARCGCSMHAYYYGPSVCISEKHENQSSVLEVWIASQSSGFLISSVSGVWIASQSFGFLICTVWGGGGDMLAILFLKVLWSSRSVWSLIPLWQWCREPADDTAG